MKLSIRHRCSDFDSYRAARVKAMFNAEGACNFALDAELPIEPDGPWKLGLVVGPSGSGKSSLGRALFGPGAVYEPEWPGDAPIVDAIAPAGSLDAVTAALAAVGLGSVPSWLRPYPVLSNGERFRANLARVLCEAPARVVIDEFTSVVDRRVARMGALAFGKAWRRTKGKCVLLSCHYDVARWLRPDWVFDTATGKFSGRSLQRPGFELEIHATDWSHWPAFEPHHYLKLPRMIAATCYVGTVAGEPVCHVAFSTRPGLREARACRLVVMPEWQGAGVGMRFLNGVCDLWLRGENRYGRPMPTLFHTSHPGLCAALRRDRNWRQVSAALHGAHKARSAASMGKSRKGVGAGYGGHFRAVQGFRYLGEHADAIGGAA